MTLASQWMFCIMFVLHALSATCSPGHAARPQQHFAADCGSRPARREPREPRDQRDQRDQRTQRTPKIIAGTPTKEGQFPWQASLELLHPSMGFLGHWCGAVLIHRLWVLSAAHCVHNDLFNLPLPPLWTVVMGEHDRDVESGYEQRIPVEKIVLHQRYQNFLHDLVLMKLSMAADLRSESNIRRICLPFVYSDAGDAGDAGDEGDAQRPPDELLDGVEDALDASLAALPEKADNFLRSVQNTRRHRNATMPSMKELMSTKIMARLRQAERQEGRQLRQQPRAAPLLPKRRRNDKLMKVHADADEAELSEQQRQQGLQDRGELPYVDCVATGWGKSNISGDLTDVLLKTSVPLHHNGRCREAYGNFVQIHRGHLCAGQLNGKGGTCVGDSGGPLQCRLTKNGPWILAGVTSFGSGCAIKGFPDVYTRTSFYMQWIQDTIANE